MPQCVNCGSSFVRPVDPTAWIRLWCRFTGRRPFSCWHCGWSGWLTRDQILGSPPSERKAESLPEADQKVETRVR
jgi:hypothetical protein